MSIPRRASGTASGSRKIRQVVNEALASLDAEFETLHTVSVAPRLRRNASSGRPAPATSISASPAFKGLSRVQRHRPVHAALGDIVPQIHTLSLDLSES
ncbi:BolA/IbaG family iron-sulfur metabolism protein [Paracoccus beibuensis]|uniref:BolA/IbaG family iron-sulfur metabolism protein n=1 Tax=Paracoccus beibuensis TaxID=547602 RepID=UPI003898E1B4